MSAPDDLVMLLPNPTADEQFVDLLLTGEFVKTRSEARRLFQQDAVKIHRAPEGWITLIPSFVWRRW